MRWASVIGFLLMTAGCTPSEDAEQARSVRTGEDEIAAQIKDRNVGYNVGQEQPWELFGEACFVSRQDSASDRQIEILFRDANKKSLGGHYEIVVYGTVPFIFNDYLGQDGEISLDGVTYPGKNDFIFVHARRMSAERSDTMFEITDSDHVFRDALLSASKITLSTGGHKVSFSMADTARMLEKLSACQKAL